MKTVITYGVFDLFHEGHTSLLKRAKALGDHLIVGVTTDQYAYERGKLTVVDPLETRIRHLLECPYVDRVVIEDRDGQKVEDIKAYNADIFAIGDDWYGKFDYLKDLCEVVYLKRTPGISSSDLRQGTVDVLRIGIIGAGRVARRFCREAAFVRDVEVVSVYHPRTDSSGSLKQFRQEQPGIQLARTVEKLFDQTDAVYIASPHETHYEYAKKALENGRHVLVEKPMALKKCQAQELFRVARAHDVVLMEAIKTAYCPGFRNLIALAQSGLIGEIEDISASFTRITPKEYREWQDKRYGGSFTELGSYGLLPVVKLFGTENLSWTFHSIRKDGVDAFTVVTVTKGDKIANVKSGIGVKTEGELVISGTNGYFYVQAPWWKTSSFEIRREDPADSRQFSFPFAGDGLRYEIADLLYRARGNTSRDYKLTPEESIQMAEVMESFLEICGGETTNGNV